MNKIYLRVASTQIKEANLDPSLKLLRSAVKTTLVNISSSLCSKVLNITANTQNSAFVTY